MKEFLTIGELADIFNMDVQLLRHYDAKGLLVPQVRNSENNRRFYHFDQVYPLATIRYLRRLDYSLAQIKAFLHSNGLRDNLQMLSRQAQQLRRGKVSAKTGSLQGVYNLAGFITTASGQRMAFVQYLSGYAVEPADQRNRRIPLVRFESRLYKDI